MKRLRRRGVVALVVAAALLVVGVVVGVAVSGDDDVAVREEESSVPVGPEPDGEDVALDVSVFTPADDAPGADGDGRRAAVVLAHGFGGSKAQLTGQARELAADGYVVLTYTARGFGRSGGRIHLDSPDYEIADVSVLLDLLAERDDVRLDADGDPRVGIAGGSYGGAVALMAAGYDDRVDAIVPAITWNDLGESLFPGGVFKQRWSSIFFATGAFGGGDDGAREEAAGPCGRFDPRVCALYSEAATTGRATPAVLRLLRRSSPAPVLSRITAPTLLLQGEQDSLFPLDQADANARGIAAAGTEVAVHWLDGGHDAGGADAGDEIVDPALAWFDQHLRDGPDAGDDFEFALPPSALEQDEGGERLRTSEYGDADERQIALNGEPQPIVAPPGGEPSAVTSLPGTGPVLGALGATGAGYDLAALPGQSAVFETASSATTLTVAGAPRIRLSVTSSARDATLFVSAWVVSSDGTATLPRQLVTPLRLSGLRPGEAARGRRRAAHLGLPRRGRPAAAGGGVEHRRGLRRARRPAPVPGGSGRAGDRAAHRRGDPGARHRRRWCRRRCWWCSGWRCWARWRWRWPPGGGTGHPPPTRRCGTCRSSSPGW